MKEVSYEGQHSVCFHLCEMPKIDKSVQTEGVPLWPRAEGEFGGRAGGKPILGLVSRLWERAQASELHTLPELRVWGVGYILTR